MRVQGDQSSDKRRMRSRRSISLWFAGLVLSLLSLLGHDFVGRTSFIFIQRQGTDWSRGAILQFQQNNVTEILPIALVLNGSNSRTSFGSDQMMPTPNHKGKTFPRVCVDGPVITPAWEWHYYSNRTTPITPRKRLLIATYSAFGQYARLLELTSPVNKAYAKTWNCDIVVLQGTTMILPWDKGCNPPEERSRFNKITLLLMALEKKNEYDHLLLLDADTLIYDFSFNISDLISETVMLVALRVHEDDPIATKRINNGVTLWNLHHPFTAQVAEDWYDATSAGIPDNRPFRGDQFYLRQILNSESRVSVISTVWDEFHYRNGTVIKHFQRSDDRTWTETGLDVREERIVEVTSEICERFAIDKHELDVRNYTAITHSTNYSCVRKRKSDWQLSEYSKNVTNQTSKRLLLAQYSSYGEYASLMELTAPINKAYGKKWGHDVLIVQGTALVLNSDPRGCEPPKTRAMYNKIPILIYALSETKKYDQVLILDADALIYDLDFDITTLIGENDMLAAQGVDKNGTIHTWNINNGVTLWNLRHDLTQKIVQKWFQRTTTGLNGAQQNDSTAHGDQYYLHKALKREKEAIKCTKALREEFQYENATVVKHFVRPNSKSWIAAGKDERELSIQLVVEDICRKFPLECDDLNRVPYATI